MKLALYKGEGNLFNATIRWWEAGIYSHCELVFSDGMCASASYRDGRRVRGKFISFDDTRWDFIDLPDHLEANALAFYIATVDTPYDMSGQVRFLFGCVKGDNNKFWCSEWCAAALGMPEPWRYGPNALGVAVRAAVDWSKK